MFQFYTRIGTTTVLPNATIVASSVTSEWCLAPPKAAFRVHKLHAEIAIKRQQLIRASELFSYHHGQKYH